MWCLAIDKKQLIIVSQEFMTFYQVGTRCALSFVLLSKLYPILFITAQ